MFYDEVMRVQALSDQGLAQEATKELMRLVGHAADPVEHYGLGCCLSRLGLFELAEAAFETALPHVLTVPRVGYAALDELAEVKFCLGKFNEARQLRLSLQGREWLNDRLSGMNPNDPALDMFRSHYDKWLGAQSVEGKSITVFNRGGFGDFLHHVRYVEHLKDEGAAVVFCQPPGPLQELIGNSRLPVEMTTLTLEGVMQCDFWAYPFDLFVRYQHSPSSPSQATGYLRPVRPVPSIPLPSSSGRRKVGIVWRSDNRTCRHEPFRSMELDTLAPLFDIDSIQFYSLQFGCLSETEQATLGRHQVIDMSPFIHSLADTAGILSQLDLLISVDSMPVHLAGGCDVPVWAMLARAADGRWGDRSQSTTPWYPSVRLFRQIELGEWNPVIQEIATALRAVTL